VVPLTVEEVERLAEHAPSERARLGILLQSYCGLRAGELGGLHVEDIDGSRLHIRRQVVRLPGGLVESELKTRAARHAVYDSSPEDHPGPKIPADGSSGVRESTGGPSAS
jgi:integrase